MSLSKSLYVEGLTVIYNYTQFKSAEGVGPPAWLLFEVARCEEDLHAADCHHGYELDKRHPPLVAGSSFRH